MKSYFWHFSQSNSLEALDDRMVLDFIQDKDASRNSRGETPAAVQAVFKGVRLVAAA